METITGSVEEIVFYNKENGYCVCDIDSEGKLITATGIMHYISPGETVTLTGNFVMHAVYGEQFQVTAFSKTPPNSTDSIYKYLSSGLIKGIGPASAKKIVDAFGEETLSVIENTPEKLSEIKGISIKKAYEINSRYIIQFGIKNLVMFLQKHGISVSHTGKIHKILGSDAVKKIKENPYLLAQKIEGIGFKTADNLAFGLGFDKSNPERIKSGVKFTLAEASSYGNTYYPKKMLIQKACSILECCEQSVRDAIDMLVIEKQIVCEQFKSTEAVYLKNLHICESNAAIRLKGIANKTVNAPECDFEKIIEKAEKSCNIKLQELQKEAIISAFTLPVLVITGGPGTGKTTVINSIIVSLESKGKKVALAAPTGRAAKRMTDVTGKEAKTLHRLLEIGFSKDDDKNNFARNESNPIDADVIIVDEASMIDISLFNSLLKAIKSDTNLILVGDADQLPSVGPGNVLRDIINSGIVKTIKLTEIFRQAKESMIVVNAHRVNNGLMPECNIKSKDFFFINKNTPEEIIKTISELCLQRLPKTYGVNPMTDIQVLTPMRKSAVGVNVLNQTLQEVLNPPAEYKKEKSSGVNTYRVNDKVMQIRNNYDIEWETDETEGMGLFNGEIGRIESISNEYESMQIVFDENKTVEYDFHFISDIEPAYATTVHKSQGSEFPVIIMPIYSGSPTIMSRNLLYTAITRAKKLVILVGRYDILEKMIKNNSEIKRFCGLKEKLLRD